MPLDTVQTTERRKFVILNSLYGELSAAVAKFPFALST